jgi:hypothetical protein
MATDICNAVNAQHKLKICTHTFRRSLKMYTDFEPIAIISQKTGSKDSKSDWAKARVTSATQILAQINCKLGMEIDGNNTLLWLAFEDVEKENASANFS